jgi:hypothetical protein
VDSAINWQAIATIAAALLVVAAGAIGYLVRGREERRNILSVSLFHLFEIWHELRLLSQWQPADLVDVMFDEIKEQMPSLQIPESEKRDAARIVDIVWRPFVLDLIGKRGQSTEKSLFDTIENLSKVDPLVAVRLNGNRTLKAAIVAVNAYFKSYETYLAASNPAELPHFQAAAYDAQDFIHGDVLQDLENDLRSLSLRIGITMWIRTAWHLRMKRKTRTDDFRKAIRPYVTKLLPHIQSSQSSMKSAAARSTLPASPNP